MPRTDSASSDLRSVLTRTRRRLVLGTLCDRLCAGGLIAVIAMLIATVLGAMLQISLYPHWLGAGMVLIAIATTLWRIPRLTDAAMVLDDLNQTSELLSTAWLIRGRSDPWSAQLVSMASAASRSMASPPSTGRHGWRRLAAILLALSATTLAGSMIDDHAADERTGMLATTTSADRARANDIISLAQRSRGAFGDPETQFPDRPTLLPDPRTGSGESQNTQGDDARGTGRATVSIERADGDPLAVSVTPIASRNGEAPGSGDGALSPDARGIGDARGAVSARLSDQTAPWLTPTWPAAQTTVEQALRAGEYPDTYRPLIRAYFER